MTQSTLNYVEFSRNRKEILVLLHGNGENLDYFKHLINPLQKDFHLLLVDTRGHGKSPKGNAPFTLKQFARDLKELLDELGYQKIHLLGYSDGANIALYFALDNPEYLQSMILVSGNFHPGGLIFRAKAAMWMQYFFYTLFQSRTKQDQIDLLKLMLFEPDLTCQDLEKITAPTLVISSEHDLIRKSHTKELTGSLAQAVWKEISGDHFAIYQNPKSICELALSFLKKNEKGEA